MRGIPQTKEAREARAHKIGEAIRKHWNNPEFRAKALAGTRRHWGDPEAHARHAAANRKSVRRKSVRNKLSLYRHTPEARLKISEASKRLWDTQRERMTAIIKRIHTGKIALPAERKNRSQALKKSYLNPLRGRTGPNRWHMRKYNGITMRSSYEVAFAKWCDDRHIVWQYEPKTFALSCGTYRPDFYLTNSDLWVETKGYQSPQFKKKFVEFMSLCKGRVVLATREVLNAIGCEVR